MTIETVTLYLRTLVFKNPKYISKKFDILTYDVDMGADIPDEKKEHWYITEGVREDCVFYLDAVDSRAREFYLKKLVCGISNKMLQKTN